MPAMGCAMLTGIAAVVALLGPSMKAIVIAPLGILIAACATGPALPKSDPSLDVDEAVFRALMMHNASAEMPNKKGIILCMPNKADPDSAFLKRFSTTVPPVSACSAYRTEGVISEAVLKANGQPVIVFSVTMSSVYSASKATAIGRYFEAGESGAEYTFQLELRNRAWVVVSQHMNWIS
jgi:hypothetical protein